MDDIIDISDTTVTFFIPMTIKRSKGRTMIILPTDADAELNQNLRHYDEKLIKAFARAYQWQEWLKKGKYKELRDICKKENIGTGYASRIYRLNFTAPKIVESILDGKQPRTLSLQDFIRKSIPDLWCEQLEVFGFNNPSKEQTQASNQCYEAESRSKKCRG